MKILVCGGRKYTQKSYLFKILDLLHDTVGVTCVVHGDAGYTDEDTGLVIWGADRLAGEWARINSIQEKKWPANRDRYGKAAGRMRNVAMFEGENPDTVIAFPSGPGTKHMVQYALANGKDVLDALTKKITKGVTRQPPDSQLPGM